jgi:hypothetical protein
MVKDFYLSFFSSLVSEQTGKSGQILESDIKSDPMAFIQGFSHFIEHYIHLVDTRGIEEFLTHAKDLRLIL